MLTLSYPVEFKILFFLDWELALLLTIHGYSPTSASPPPRILSSPSFTPNSLLFTTPHLQSASSARAAAVMETNRRNLVRTSNTDDQS